MNKKLIIGNWKMYCQDLVEAKKIVAKAKKVAALLENTEVVDCVPTPFLGVLASRRSANFHIGAQSVSVEKEGAHTGDVGAVALGSAGAEYVIVGHSEQRKAGDTDELVSKKANAALEAGLKAIVCVGEDARDVEGGSHFDFLKKQINDSLANIPAKLAKGIVVAYEPVWAIGAKEAMNPEQIYEMSLFVRKVIADIFSQEAALKAIVLYGGSVNAANAADIVRVGQIDGILVGRESVNATGFSLILKAVDAIA